MRPGAEKDPNSLLHNSDWVSLARSVNAQLDDEFERAPGLYSFGSPDGPPPPPGPNGVEYWIDPNGRLDVNVALQSDGRYWVTGLSIEFHN